MPVNSKNHKFRIAHRPGSIFEIIWVLFLGCCIGFLTLGFMKSLIFIEKLQRNLNQETPYHLLLIPIVLLVINVIRRNTLYFPTKLVHLSQETSSNYWSVLMLPFHYVGTLLSHVSGVSIGREGAVVLYSAGLVRLFKFEWHFWGPIVSAMGFSAVVGQFWVAPFFISELFNRTNLYQKIYSFIGGMVAVLIVRSCNLEQLFTNLDISANPIDIGFMSKFFFIFLFSMCAGYLMRFYKFCYNLLTTHFQKYSLTFKIFMSCIISIFLYVPEFRKYQSLGLIQILNLSEFSGNFFDVISKLFMTLISTTLGFLGGEFIPLVYSGVHFGYSFFNFFGHSVLMGSILGAYLLFAGATRFKWTSYILILNLIGLSWWFWAYFMVSVCIHFSGQGSLYKNDQP